MKPFKNDLWNDVLLYLLYVIGICIVVWFFSSCSAAKKANGQVKDLTTLSNTIDSIKESILAKGIADYLKNNPPECPELNLDSLCSQYYNCPETYITPTKEFSEPPKPKPCTPQRIMYPVEDKRQVNLLFDTIAGLRRQLAGCNGNLAGRKETTAEIIPPIVKEMKPGKWAVNGWFWLFLAMLTFTVGKLFIRKKLF